MLAYKWHFSTNAMSASFDGGRSNSSSAPAGVADHICSNAELRQLEASKAPHLLPKLTQSLGRLIHLAAWGIVGHGVGVDQPHVRRSFGRSLVDVLFRIGFDQSQAHGLLDDRRVVEELQLSPVHGFAEGLRVFASNDLLGDFEEISAPLHDLLSMKEEKEKSLLKEGRKGEEDEVPSQNRGTQIPKYPDTQKLRFPDKHITSTSKIKDHAVMGGNMDGGCL